MGTGTLHVALDLRVEDGALPTIEWRDWFGGPIRTGPHVAVTAKGKLVGGGRPLMDFPRNTWVGLDTVCVLGRKRTGSFSLTVALPGEAPRTWNDLPCRYPKFAKVNWIGIISDAQSETRFQIDNFRFEPAPADAE